MIGFSDSRYADRSNLGKSSLGTLLELGPERNLGSSYVDRLFAVCTSALVPQEYSACAILDTDCVLPFATDVLVWGELPSCRTAKRTFIQPFLAF